MNGAFNTYVGPKDLILHLIGKLTRRGRELQGAGVPRRDDPEDVDLRAAWSLCNMSVEAGATAGIVPADEETIRYLREEAGVTDPIEPVVPDADAVYERVIEIDVSKLEPQIACPHTVDNVKPIDEVAGQEGPPDRHRLLHQRPAR